MISYSLEDSGIFHVNFTDTVTLEDIKSYLLEFERLDKLPANFLSLYDLRGAELQLSAEDLAQLSELTEKATYAYAIVKTAFVVDKPKLTAYTLLFSTDHNSEKTTRQVFSTIKVACNWLLNINY